MKYNEIKHEVITVNDIDYLIRSLKDRQQFNDDDQRAEELGIFSATWSLFGVVWPSSRVLASVVSQEALEGKRVLEIGCGIALTSIVLHQMGIDVTASDYHPLAQEFLDKNILANDLQPIKYETGNWEADNPLLGNFDLIIGSDVLYEPNHAELVSQFINRHSDKNIDVIIIDPERGNRSLFTRKMEALGFEHHFERFNVPGTLETQCKGRILHYHRH